jgi:amidase
VWQAGVAYAGIPKEVLQPMNQWLLERSVSAGDYLRAVDGVHAIARRIVAFFDSVDALILPTYMHPTIRVGEWAGLSPEQTLQKIIYWVAPCPPFNASGLPAIAIPTGFAPNGLPIGIQIVGRPTAEATIIAIAAQLEVDKFWSQHRPAIANG